MSKEFFKLFNAALLMIFAFALLLPVSAQSVPKKSSSASTTCDGALDIVPTKSLSFVRKRRPGKEAAKKEDANQQTAPANSKALPKPPNK